MLKIKKNKQGDVIEVHNDLVLNLSYWDCECADNYIKTVTVSECTYCGASIDDCANSRDDEVQSMIYNNGSNKIILKLLANGIISHKNEYDYYDIANGYYIMVNNYYDSELSIMDNVYVINDKCYVGNRMSEEYEITDIKDLIITKEYEILDLGV